MLYWISFAAIAFAIGLQLLAKGEARLQEARQFRRENRTREPIGR
jgi:hypothetical protein